MLSYKNRIFAVILLCSIPCLNIFAQKSKTPLRPILSISTDTTCTPGCHFFEYNVNELIGTDNLNFSAMIDNEFCIPPPPNAQLGCLLQVHNPRWILVKILSGKDLNFSINNSQNHDIDAAVWGPIANQDLSNSCEAIANFPADCDYSNTTPSLTINDAVVGEYYIMLISNFSNANTDISLIQPSGGSVKYSYYCPENIQLNANINGSQTQNAFSTIKLGGTLNDSSKVKAYSGNQIELLPGFSTSNDVTFEAKIQGCINTTETYLPPNSTLVCESFANHSGNTPHIYTNYLQNEIVATVFAKSKPQFLVYNNWVDAEKFGKDLATDRYMWSFRYPFQHALNVAIRTGHGCPMYPDTRLTEMHTYLGNEATTIPTLPIVQDTANIDSPFWLATDLSTPSSSHSVYTLYLKPGIAQYLSYSINGGPRYYNIEEYDALEEYNDRPINVTKTGSFSAPKDFIIDFSPDHGISKDRYLVTRNSCGGHFGVTTTFTRLADSTVTVSTFQGDIFVKSKLGSYECTPLFANCFKLGHLPVGEYNFPLTSEKGTIVLDEEIKVRVRYQ